MLWIPYGWPKAQPQRHRKCSVLCRRHSTVQPAPNHGAPDRGGVFQLHYVSSGLLRRWPAHIVARLSPAKCHWASCKFCTINSQHLMPRGHSVYNSTYEHYFELLARKIGQDNVDSIILMDEALHPNVLLAFARGLLSKRISILYRARCRFTNDLTDHACELLYKSGCRYLGLGLESASPRVNRLVHKHMGAPIDYDTVLQDLENSGIQDACIRHYGLPNRDGRRNSCDPETINQKYPAL